MTTTTFTKANEEALEIIANAIANGETPNCDFEFEGETFNIDVDYTGEVTYARNDEDGSLELDENTFACKDVKVYHINTKTEDMDDVTSIDAIDVERKVEEVA